MKKLIHSSIIYVFLFIATTVMSQKIAPYVKVGSSTKSIKDLTTQIKGSLSENNFIYLGSYAPEGNSKLKVIAFTSKNVMNTVLKVKDRGALAAVLKIALIKKENLVTISYLNPDYIFNAYLGKSYDNYKTSLQKVSTNLKNALDKFGDDFENFGGGITTDKLRKYHYKMMMPYFSDPVELKEFNTFEEGVEIIKNNLSNKKGNTKKIYELIFKSKKIAVFGIALTNKEKEKQNFYQLLAKKISLQCLMILF